MVRQDVLPCICALLSESDIQIKRDAAFASANFADALELQSDMTREGAIPALAVAGKHEDARVQVRLIPHLSNITLFEWLILILLYRTERSGSCILMLVRVTRYMFGSHRAGWFTNVARIGKIIRRFLPTICDTSALQLG